MRRDDRKNWFSEFLRGIGVEVEPNMIANPRESSYVRTDDWDDEAVKWYERADAKKDTA